MENVNVKSDSATPKDIKISPESNLSELDINDLIFLSKNSFGLRHVSTKEQAKKEMSEGLRGDALAISSIINLAKNCRLSEKLSSNTDEENQSLVNALTDSIKEFISFNIGHYINHLPTKDQTTVGLATETLISNGGAFLIGVFQFGNRGYDNWRYYRLGKCGTQAVKSENIKGLIEVDESDINLLSNNFTDKMDEDKFQLIKSKMTNVLFPKFVSFIHIQEALSHKQNPAT